MKSSKKFSNKKRKIVTSILAIFVLLSAKKVFDYATPPNGEKDCDFIYPNLVDQTKPTTITIATSIALEQEGGTINDASCLNKTSVYGIVKVSAEADIAEALTFAKENNLKVTSAGQRHSMGGQSFIQNGLVLDMKNFNQISIDKENKILHAQSGATWDQIQQFLDKENLSVNAMQSINIFTVGGTMSVNAHGMDHNAGQISTTIKSIRVMLSSGEIKTASPTENEDLFKHVLGGYGLFGVILDADLELTDNEMYERDISYIDYHDFKTFYEENIENNSDYGLFFARFSVAPHSYLKELALHKYKRLDPSSEIQPITSLQTSDESWTHRLVWNVSKLGGFGRTIRWALERYVEPKLHRCTMSRNESMSQSEVCLVSRNQEMYDTVKNLRVRLPDTDILQEYFIPREKMVSFVDGLRSTVESNGANLLNATVRIVPKDTITALPYAKEDMFAFVLYFNQKLSDEDIKILQKTTSDLIDLATSLNGTYYLPYQLYYSQEQLQKAYPEIDEFFAAKKEYDPAALFDNKFYQKYGKL